jgi:tricorn protease
LTIIIIFHRILFTILNEAYMKKVLSVLLICLYVIPSLANLGYFRYPDLHNDTLVFTAEGDIWLADIQSGVTQRLTTHEAEETQASLSNDGKQIAFAANYEGATEVYVIPIHGGLAKRISFENARVRIHGWTDAGDVIYSSNGRVGIPGHWEIVTVNPQSLKTKTVPLTDAIDAAFDETESMVYFSRFGLQQSGDNSKVYRGGAIGKLWQFKLGSNKEAEQMLLEHKGSIRKPMNYQDKVYFISDASGADNLWSVSKITGTAQKVTNYTDWSVRTANIAKDKIVYQVGADIKSIDLATQKINDISLKLTSDFPNMREHWLNSPLKNLTSGQLAGDFEKVVLTARGRVAVAGIDKSRLVQLATPADSRSRQAILSDDGQWVYAINDSSGELEIWQYAADGSNQSKQLTNDGSVFRWSLSLSPDGKWLAHDDKDGNLFLLNTDSGKNKKILEESNGFSPMRNMTWSNNSQLLAISRLHVDKERNQVMLYSLNEDKFETLTSLKYDSYSPAFSVDNQWLYFLSDRNFVATPGAPWGDRNMGVLLDRRTLVYAYALKSDAKFAFQKPNELMPKEDQVDTEGEEKKPNKKDKKELYKVDWKNLKKRLWQLPIKAGNYSQLAVNQEYIYLKDEINEPGSKPKIVSVKLKPFAEAKDFTSAIKNFNLSDDGKKIMVQNDKDVFFIVDAGAEFPKKTKDVQVQTGDWQLLINPAREWKQLFHDTWLMHRDSLFDKNMRGLNWAEVQNKYSPLLNRITDRYELNDVFKQMIGELNTLHSQVRGGDVAIDENSAKVSVLGADLLQTSKGVVIDKIYQHDFDRPETASPLSQPGVNAQNGDTILKINGLKTPDLASVHLALRNQLNKQVLIELKRKGKSFKSILTPVSTRDNYQLRYKHWVSTKKQEVQAANSEIGYLHLQAMGGNDVAHFAREFYANYDKQSLIIDVRRNRGGNIDSMIIEKLLRRNWMFWQQPNGAQFKNMQQTFGGHLVVLCDEFTYSDGETFVAGIQALDLATVIGKQTTGAGVWLTGRNRVSDGGMSRVAELPQYANDGRWVVEGHGVEPDIEVDNLPHATFKGEDAQLQAAIDYLNAKMKQEPHKPIKAQKIPSVNTPAQDIIKN